MKKKVIIILISLIPFVCVSYSQEREDEFFRVGTDATPYIEKSWVDTVKPLMILVNSYSFKPAYHIKLDNVNYIFTVREKTIDYIATSDRIFLINGYKVGTIFNNDYIKNCIIREPGWGSFIAVGNRWFTFVEEEKPVSEVTIFFQKLNKNSWEFTAVPLE